jgi:hypothetical protein
MASKTYVYLMHQQVRSFIIRQQRGQFVPNYQRTTSFMINFTKLQHSMDLHVIHINVGSTHISVAQVMCGHIPNVVGL